MALSFATLTALTAQAEQISARVASVRFTDPDPGVRAVLARDLTRLSGFVSRIAQPNPAFPPSNYPARIARELLVHADAIRSFERPVYDASQAAAAAHELLAGRLKWTPPT